MPQAPDSAPARPRVVPESRVPDPVVDRTVDLAPAQPTPSTRTPEPEATPVLATASVANTPGNALPVPMLSQATVANTDTRALPAATLPQSTRPTVGTDAPGKGSPRSWRQRYPDAATAPISLEVRFVGVIIWCPAIHTHTHTRTVSTISLESLCNAMRTRFVSETKEKSGYLVSRFH